MQEDLFLPKWTRSLQFGVADFQPSFIQVQERREMIRFLWYVKDPGHFLVGRGSGCVCIFLFIQFLNATVSSIVFNKSGGVIRQIYLVVKMDS